MRPHTLVPICLGLAVILAVGAPPALAAETTAAVTIDTTRVAQTMQGTGGDYTNGGYSQNDGFTMTAAQDDVGRYTLTHLHPDFARVNINLSWWEPNNDNDDPGVIDWTQFQDTGRIHDQFLFLQDLQRRGVHILGSVWTTPNWMVTNPGNGNNRTLASYAETSESLAAYLLRARDTYGVTIDAVSFNEPNIGVNHYLSPQDYAALIKTGGALFASSGLSTKWFAGDTGYIDCAGYTQPILEDPLARQYVAAVAYHSWVEISTGCAALADQYHLPFWDTEAGYDPEIWATNPQTWSTWDNAWRLADNYTRAVKDSRVTVILPWTYQYDFPLMSADTTLRYPAYYVVKQLVDNLTAGTRIVAADSTNDNLLTLAGTSDNHFFTQVINRGSDPVTVTFAGIPTSSITLLRTSSTENMADLGVQTVTSGQLQLTLPAGSISMLTTLGYPADEPLPTAAPIGQTISLQAQGNGRFVSAWQDSANTPLQARANRVAAGERFTVTDAGNGYVALLAANGSYVSAWQDTTNAPLQARAGRIDAWERFQWVDLGGGSVALKSVANSQYVSSWLDEPNAPLEARAPRVDTWEQFHWATAS